MPCDLVIIGTPIDFRRVVLLDKESVRVTYELEEIGQPKLDTVMDHFLMHVSGREPGERGRRLSTKTKGARKKRTRKGR